MKSSVQCEADSMKSQARGIPTGSFFVPQVSESQAMVPEGVPKGSNRCPIVAALRKKAQRFQCRYTYLDRLTVQSVLERGDLPDSLRHSWQWNSELSEELMSSARWNDARDLQGAYMRSACCSNRRSISLLPSAVGACPDSLTIHVGRAVIA